MIVNNIKLENRGQEIVYIYGERTRRAVYCVPNAWKFYVKVNGEAIEVFHKSCWFSTEA